MFRTRLLSGIILILVMIGLIVPGNAILLVALAVISCIGLFELYRVFKIEKDILGYIGYAAALVYYANLWFHFASDLRLLVIATLFVLFFVYVFSYPKYEAKQILESFFGIFYVAVMLSYIYSVRMMNDGAYIVWLIFLCAWGCDTCAYCVGMLFGKHKLAPVLSPKKSIEGAIGGVVGAALLGAIYGAVLHHIANLEGAYIWIFAVLCGIGAVFAQIGDLTASAIKRNYQIKDYGKLIPGHGGIMDRFDSVLVTAPLIYYLAWYFTTM